MPVRSDRSQEGPFLEPRQSPEACAASKDYFQVCARNNAAVYGGGYLINPGTGNKNYWFPVWQGQRDPTKGRTLGAEIWAGHLWGYSFGVLLAYLWTRSPQQRPILDPCRIWYFDRPQDLTDVNRFKR